jgi:ABC-type Na+ efflux pump permease subunit
VLAGPLFNREVLTQPRHLQHYLIRTGYVLLLMILLYTASQATFGWQQYRSLQAQASFGILAFQLFSIVQLTLAIFLALLSSANMIAQEKDRRTFDLLLITDLHDAEIVIGKLLGSLLPVLTLLTCSIPVFVAIYALGGITIDQVIWLQVLCLASAFAAGSWGILVALWRDKTFQTLAISFLGFLMMITISEGLFYALSDRPAWAGILSVLDPYRALFLILMPFQLHGSEASSLNYDILRGVLGNLGLGIILVIISIRWLREWNPRKSIFMAPAEDEIDPKSIVTRTRNIWEKPILWREIMTRAYGRKMIFIKLGYVLIAGFLTTMMFQLLHSSTLILGMVTPVGFLFIGLCLMGMILINAQAVTSITGERDGQTLELLLVTDISANDFIYGKLGGIFWNTKETILIPLGVLIALAVMGVTNIEGAIFIGLGYLVLTAFAAMLGIHSALSFDRSRTAIGNSLGTMFFLFIGIFICMMLIVEARSSFALQLPSFMVFILGGSIGLGVSLTAKNPSTALKLAATILPFLTFYAITAFLLGGSMDVCVSICFAYGFTVLAMLIPAIGEFDSALGRTTTGK